MTVTVSTTIRAARPAPQPRNGVDTPRLFATIDAIRQQPIAAKFEFRATTRWLKGTHTRTTIDGFFGAGSEHVHARPMQIDADHPAVLVGEDHGPTPMEIVLNALGACLVAGVANIAAARRVDLTEVTARMEGQIDLQGVLGLSDAVRNGFQGIRVRFAIRGDATTEVLGEIVEQSRRRSAVFDVLSRGVPVEVVTDAEAVRAGG